MSVVIEIPLTRGKIAVIDEADLPIVQPFTWYATKEVRGVCYAHTWRGANEVPQTIRMHRLLMAAEAGQVVDHINGDGLDNRRENLRFADARRNQWNRRAWEETSRYKGVRWYRRDQVWFALITHNGKRVHLGTFPTEVDAALAYDRAALDLFGEFARPNFPRRIHELIAAQPEGASDDRPDD